MGDWDFLHGLTGRDLEFAMSTGATYEEWQEIHERELREAIEDGDEDAVNEIMSMKMFHDYMYPSPLQRRIRTSRGTAHTSGRKTPAG